LASHGNAKCSVHPAVSRAGSLYFRRDLAIRPFPVEPSIFMNGEMFVTLIEEMIALKIHRQAEANVKPSTEVARLLQEKRATDRRRLAQIRTELVRMLNG
jgi:hypothetical protein